MDIHAFVLHEYITFWIGGIITLIYGGILSIRLLHINRLSKWEEVPEVLQKNYDGFTIRLLQRENENLFILLNYFFNLAESPVMRDSTFFIVWLLFTS